MFTFAARLFFACLISGIFFQSTIARAAGGPIRVLFLGHEAQNHRSDLYYPMLAKALGREAIYFDYVTSPEAALMMRPTSINSMRF